MGEAVSDKAVLPRNVDTNKNYGKVIFAKHVIRENASKIDFDGFKPLLARIQGVIEAHAVKVAAT